MDNPQHYQPLSHALHPPLANAQPQSGYSMFNSKPKAAAPTSRRQEEEEEEEEEDDDEEDDGLVEEQLNGNGPGTNPASNQSSPGAQPTGSTADSSTRTKPAAAGITQPPLTIVQESEPQKTSQRKRRPGRPRGSKNRKAHTSTGADASPKQHSQTAAFYSYAQTHPTASGSAPPQHPDVNAQNQQYYEFQWRVLNLCAEFYGAAEELVKATPALVIAQCYHMGPSSKVDPLTMLGEAKKICDTLLANPVQLIANPPPPLYPQIPNFVAQIPPAQNPEAPASSTPSAPPAKKSHPTPSAVITNPQTFVVSLGSQPLPPTYSHSQFPTMYTSPPAQYPTAPYYQYTGYVPPGTSYYPPPPPPQLQQPSSQAATSTLTTMSPGTTGPGVNQGAWSDEETDRLKKLAEQSKSVGTSGEMEWDWVVHQWGNGRTRHQILIKATSLGLKESSSRGTKRRRETDANAGETQSPVPAEPSSSAAAANATSASSSTDARAESASPQTLSTSASSPAMQPRPPPPGQSQRTTPAPAAGGASSSHLPWPMPTVAVNAPSPVIGAAVVSGQPEPQRTSYYRARGGPGDASAKGSPVTAHQAAPTTHQFMYQPNGARLSKENGQ